MSCAVSRYESSPKQARIERDLKMNTKTMPATCGPMGLALLGVILTTSLWSAAVQCPNTCGWTSNQIIACCACGTWTGVASGKKCSYSTALLPIFVECQKGTKAVDLGQSPDNVPITMIKNGSCGPAATNCESGCTGGTLVEGYFLIEPMVKGQEGCS
jgi:hypothetical protein